MLAREGKGAMGGLCPCAAGSAHGVRSQQGSEQPQGTCGWRITRCCCLLAPAGSDLGWDVRRGMQRWWVQRGTSVSSSVPTLGRGVGSCSLSGALSGKLELEFCHPVTRSASRLKTRGWWDLSTSGDTRRAGEGKSLLPACWAPA